MKNNSLKRSFMVAVAITMLIVSLCSALAIFVCYRLQKYILPDSNEVWLIEQINPEMSSFVFRETLMTHLLLWGNAYAQIIRNGKGEVIALYPLMPNKMSVDRDERGQLYYTYQRGTDEAIRDKNQTVILRPSDVLHIPGLGFDG